MWVNIKTSSPEDGRRGFTIVELLIVIVVIGILAAIVIVAYNGMQARAQQAKIQADLSALERAVLAARNNTGQPLGVIDGNYWTAGGCISGHAAGTDLAALPKTDPCWINYISALRNITNASNVNVVSLLDPWGRPYVIDENEGETGGCRLDNIAAYSLPFDPNNSYYPNSMLNVPLSGLTGC